MTVEDDEASEYNGVSNFLVDEATQVANMLMLAVIPQCRRSGLGTLLYKKVLWLIESQFTQCVLIYGQRNDSLQIVHNWKAVSCFLLKNHFKLVENGQLAEDFDTQLAKTQSNIPPGSNLLSANNMKGSNLNIEAGPTAIFYYPITSIVRRKDQQRSTKGLFSEVMRAFCRNPFAKCTKEGRLRFKKELEQIRKKYEKDDIILDVEQFACDEDDEESVDGSDNRPPKGHQEEEEKLDDDDESHHLSRRRSNNNNNDLELGDLVVPEESHKRRLHSD